jgi:hypothetical protein
MSARYTITVPPSRTVKCKGCRRTVNKFAIYRAHDNRTGLCRPCVLAADGVVLSAVVEARTCGQSVSGSGGIVECARLGGHKGECRPTLTRVGRCAA